MILLEKHDLPACGSPFSCWPLLEIRLPIARSTTRAGHPRPGIAPLRPNSGNPYAPLECPRRQLAAQHHQSTRRGQAPLPTSPRRDTHAPLEGPLCQLGAQRLLGELADARLRDLRDERELVRQPPL